MTLRASHRHRLEREKPPHRRDSRISKAVNGTRNAVASISAACFVYRYQAVIDGKNIVLGVEMVAGKIDCPDAFYGLPGQLIGWTD
jgi:hypothetical protein